MENLPPDKRARRILLVKHQSTYETFLMPTLMPHPLAYVFKKELIYVPFFGWAMARLDMIHIDRSQRAQAFNKVVEQGKRLLAQGIWIIMFPEGTRIPRGQKGTYKSGGTRLACETGAPVIPIAVTSAKVWPRKAFIKRPGVVDVSIGPPIPSDGRKPDELMREVEAWIEAEMRRLDPEAYLAQRGRGPRINSAPMHRLLQLTLDLFDTSRLRAATARRRQAALAAPAPSRSRRTGRRRRSRRRRAGERLDAVLVPASFRHPRAKREVVLGDAARGLRVHARPAPHHRLRGRRRGPDGERAQVGAAARRRCRRAGASRDWILRKLADANERHAAHRVGPHRVARRRDCSRSSASR